MFKIVFVFFLGFWIHLAFCSSNSNNSGSDSEDDKNSLCSESTLSRSSSVTSVFGFDDSGSQLALVQKQKDLFFTFLDTTYRIKASEFFDIIVNIDDLAKIFGDKNFNVQISSSLQTRMTRLGKSFTLNLLVSPREAAEILAPFLEFRNEFFQLFGKDSRHQVAFPRIQNLEAWNLKLGEKIASNISKRINPDAEVHFSSILAFTINNFEEIFSI